MIIQKGEKQYRVEDRSDYWEVSRTIGGLSVEYKVPKDICKDENELREYIKAEELF